MKKLIAVAVGVAVAFSATVASAATYTRDLTIGSTGADVSSLQTTLEAKGALVIPAGVAKGYFGALTKSALAKYQAANGIAPAVGYFGPITRAHFNAMSDDNGDDDNGDDNGDDELSGGEGDIKDYDVLGNPGDEDLDEGESKNVIGFEFEADGSDLRVERLEVFASATTATIGDANDSNDPWDYIESAVLYMGDDEVASVEGLDDEDEWNEEADDLYSFRFENIDAVVDEDDTAKFYVELTAVNSLDTEDEGATFDVMIPNDGLRVVDAEGIDIYEGEDNTDVDAAADERTVTFQGPDAGDLDLSLDNDDNEDRTVFADEESETEGVEIMRFTIEANSSDNTIDELDVKLASTTMSATNTLADVIKTLRLEVDGDEISSESVPSGYATVTVSFEDLEDDFAIEEDEEVEVVVYADIESQEDNFTNGFEFYAYVPGSGIDAEDSEGDSVTVSDNLYGGEIEVRVDGVQVELNGNPTATKSFIADASGEEDQGTFTIVFDVTASGEDMYIDKTVQQTSSSTPGTLGEGFFWATTSEVTGTSTIIGATVEASGSTTGDNSTYYKISEGNTRTFTLQVVLETGGTAGDGFQQIQLTGFNWDDESNDAAADNFYTIDLSEFKTPKLLLQAL